MRPSGSKKRKWPWVLGIAIILPVLVVVWLDSTIASSHIIDPRSIVAHTREELVDLYWEHKDELQEIAEIVLASDAFKQRIIDNNDDYGQTRFESGTGVFPDEDWNKIVALYQKIRCYDIVRHCWGGVDGAVSIDFREKKADGQDISTRLFYFKDLHTMEFYKLHRYSYNQFGWRQTLEPIDGGWYAYESVIPRET